MQRDYVHNQNMHTQEIRCFPLFMLSVAKELYSREEVEVE